MDWNVFFIRFLVLMLVVPGIIIFVLRMALGKGVDDARQRLDRDAEAARQRERDLNEKIKEADAELQRRQKMLDMMERKMRQELEEKASKEKEELIQKARAEAEEIITKAQNAKEAIRHDIEKTMEIRMVDYSLKVMNDVLSHTVKETVDRQLFVEFVEKLKNVDMSHLGPDVNSADVISAHPLGPLALDEISKVFKEKILRDVLLNPKIDKTIIGGVILQFESLLLDGSLQNAFKTSANAIKAQVEKQYPT
ncbi:MAG: F0F1 ATP synthase subunit delta [Candidatus Omnitrophica bacterium]|nr:F0F1 ATP synthase subunit delta [Candidatus Omnitrophota bacterium]